MSSSKHHDVQRKTWDLATFERRAADRANAERDAENERRRARKAAADPSNHQDGDPFAPTRAWLRKRDHTIDFSSKVGTIEVVGSSVAGGFQCKVCDVTLKDSNRFMAHVNSSAHHKALGISMRVRRSTVKEIEQAFSDAVRRRGVDMGRAVPE